jgi:hypothetical protein
MHHDHPNRRIFVCSIAAIGSLGATHRAFAQARAEEDSEQAVALGYRHDTSKVDTKKYPKHAVTQRCSNCSFWQGKPEDPWAGCAMFGRKQIAHAGWCMAWQKQP